MSDYPHLKLPFRLAGVVKPTRFPREHNPRTIQNREQRKIHGDYLMGSAANLIDQWKNIKSKTESEGFKLPNEDDIPVFLKVDTDEFNIDSLINWGIEVVSEEEDGYIIGASVDNLETFKKNVQSFLEEQGMYRNTAAKIWEVVTDDSWRLKELLKGELGRNWDKIEDAEIYTIQIGVSCGVVNKTTFPVREDFASIEAYEQKLSEYLDQQKALFIQRDEKQIEREGEVDMYTKTYGGTIHDVWDNGNDAEYFKISICGKGLKDIVLTYQYLFEVKLNSEFEIEESLASTSYDYDIKILPPEKTSARVCVIDSGIQENHKLIEPAIDKSVSKSYVDGDPSTADYVKQSGHGTKVAGAILYPNSIPTTGQIRLESIIENARILDQHNTIATDKFEPKLIEEIVHDFSDTKIFNLSVAEHIAYDGVHMPAFAASIDKLIHEKDLLFVISTGNIKITSNGGSNTGIVEHLKNGKDYPGYLLDAEARIANPAVSSFGIAVGSISRFDFDSTDYKAIAGKDHVSPFSRSGLGLWGSVKPDVVEFGGDLLVNKHEIRVTGNEETLMPELVNSTMHGAKAVGKDFGTSFSAPKVTYIASKLKSEHPNETSLMLRALIIQSARLPEHCFNNPTAADLRFYGYGVPDLNRAMFNSPTRITFIQDGKIEPKKADIYRLVIPEGIRGEGREFRILIEITLSFTSGIRSTRKGAHPYLANWIEWKSSKYNESFASFRNRTIKYLETDSQPELDEAADAIRWVLRENPAWTRNGINRNNSSVQKSWTIIDPHQFAEEFSIAVIGHCGWDKNMSNQVPYSICVSFEVLEAEVNIYEILAEAQVEIEPEQEIEI